MGDLTMVRPPFQGSFYFGDEDQGRVPWAGLVRAFGPSYHNVGRDGRAGANPAAATNFQVVRLGILRLNARGFRFDSDPLQHHGEVAQR